MEKSVKCFYIGIVLALITAIGLAGCGFNSNGANQGTGTGTSGQPDSSAAYAKAPLNPVELVWYLPVAPQKDTDLVEQELNRYLKDRINASIELRYIDMGSWDNKFPVLLASGETIDIMFTAGWCQYPQNVAKGYFTDITDLLPRYAPGTTAELPQLLLDGAKINGKIYAVPTNKELAHTNGFLFNVNLAQKLGVLEQLRGFENKMPTIDDLAPVLSAAKAKGDGYILMSTWSSSDYPRMFLDFDPIGDENIPGKLYPNKDTTVIDEFETPEYMNVLKTVHKFYQAGYWRKDAETLSDVLPDIAAQKVLMWGGTTKPLANEEVGTSFGMELEQFSVTKPFTTANDVTGSMNAVLSSSRNKERALMFLELVNTDAYVNNTLNYGIENRHYVKKGDNLLAFAPGLDANTSGYVPNAFWEFGNQFLNYFMTGQNTKKWDLFEAYSHAAAPSKILGFNFDAEPVKTEIAAVTNVRRELYPAIATGAADPEVYLPKMIEKMKQAGLNKILAEKQKQIDAWLAAKK